jgi:hypothetical protein
MAIDETVKAPMKGNRYGDTMKLVSFRIVGNCG